MKVLNHISFLIVMLILMFSFFQCSSAQKLQKKAPTEFGEAYYQTWVSGVKNGGSGINIFIPVKDNQVALDSVYFRGKVTKLELMPGSNLMYVGRFKTEGNQPKDIILSSDSKEEYSNTLPSEQVSIPFSLKEDECIVSYILQDQNILYYKITNIKQKEPVHYPSAPPDQN